MEIYIFVAVHCNADKNSGISMNLTCIKIYIGEFFKEGKSMAYRVVVVMKRVRSRWNFSS